MNAALGRGFHDLVAHVFIEAAQNLVAAIAERDVGAEPREDVRELNRNIAGAGDEDALGEFLEIEGFVRRDAMFGAGDVYVARRDFRRWRSGYVPQ